MRDRDTTVRAPHSATVTRKAGRKHVETHDARVSVTMQESGATLTLFFESAEAWTGVAPPVEVRLTPPDSGDFEPWRLMSRLPMYLKYARATLADRQHDVADSLNALREQGSTRRGLSDRFYHLIAQEYLALEEAGERHPIKALAEARHADKSTASRWVSGARARGFLPEVKS